MKVAIVGGGIIGLAAALELRGHGVDATIYDPAPPGSEASLALAIIVVSFPLLLDRDVGLPTAVWTSIRAVAANPRTMAVWGLIVAGGLVIGSILAFVGLIIVMPVLGYATWHLYRKVVP